MADIDSRLDKRAAEPIGVTTGPIRGSRKVHVASPTGSGMNSDLELKVSAKMNCWAYAPMKVMMATTTMPGMASGRMTRRKV